MRVPAAHTLVGMFVIEDAIEVRDAPNDVEAVFVFAFTSATTDDDAFCTSDCTASEPESKPAPVRVRVPLPQTSEASVPNEVRVRAPDAQTLVGTNEIAEETDEIAAPREVEARLVFAFTSATTELEALPTVVLVLLFTLAVPAEIAAEREVLAV